MELVKDSAMANAIMAANAEPEEEQAVAEQKPQKPAFATWEVGGKTYRLKLSTADVTQLETKYKTNLMNVMGADEGGMPALSVMLDVAQAAMKTGEGTPVSRNLINSIFDKYVDEGGSQMSFYTQVYMNIFLASGFFSPALAAGMEDGIQEARAIL
ncbi:MAG: DUF6096 family protein [Clostridia bacterium]|nr:DUF6096 family protein [Clostridia bacterium]